MNDYEKMKAVLIKSEVKFMDGLCPYDNTPFLAIYVREEMPTFYFDSNGNFESFDVVSQEVNENDT